MRKLKYLLFVLVCFIGTIYLLLAIPFISCNGFRLCNTRIVEVIPMLFFVPITLVLLFLAFTYKKAVVLLTVFYTIAAVLFFSLVKYDYSTHRQISQYLIYTFEFKNHYPGEVHNQLFRDVVFTTAILPISLFMSSIAVIFIGTKIYTK